MATVKWNHRRFRQLIFLSFFKRDLKRHWHLSFPVQISSDTVLLSSCPSPGGYQRHREVHTDATSRVYILAVIVHMIGFSYILERIECRRHRRWISPTRCIIGWSRDWIFWLFFTRRTSWSWMFHSCDSFTSCMHSFHTSYAERTISDRHKFASTSIRWLGIHLWHYGTHSCAAPRCSRLLFTMVQSMAHDCWGHQ